jgi:hypothetical protein
LSFCLNASKAQAGTICSVDPTAKQWLGTGQDPLEIIVKGDRCLFFVQANSKLYPGKRTAWLIEGKSGDLLAEFYAPISPNGPWGDNDRGLCSFGGHFPTFTCTWVEWRERADQM